MRVCLHWAVGYVSLRELRSVPAVNPVCMICARDFNASCVLAEMRSCSDQGGADCRSHRAAILTNTHVIVALVKVIVNRTCDHKDCSNTFTIHSPS